MSADHGRARCKANIRKPEHENADRLVFRKAPGHDGIPIDSIKYCKSVLLHPLHEVLCGVGRRELFHNTQEVLKFSPSINAKTIEVTLKKNPLSVRLLLLLAFETNFTKKQTYEVYPVTC